jgi:serine/threonine protein kinase
VDAIAATIHKSPRTVRRLLEQTRNKIESYLKNGATTARTGVHSTMPLVADPRAQLAYSDYRLERVLGAGGMGKVYRATHLNTGNTVAIKALPRSRQADPNSVEKFLQEAQILSSLNHPNIVRFQGVGRFPGGGYFFVMDFIDGEDFQSRIDKQSLPLEEALRVVRDIGKAVAHVHERGVVHGDLKPANILVDRGDRVFITDFGLAQFNSLRPGQRPWLVGGTAGYVAPEVRIHGQVPTPQSDVFGLGALLWSLITADIPQLPLITPGTVKMPQSVFAACARCLDDNPDQRFRSIEEFVAQLDSLGLTS